MPDGAMARGARVVILTAPAGNPTGPVDPAVAVAIRAGEALIALDQNGRQVRVRGPYRGPLAQRIGHSPTPSRVAQFFQTIAKLFTTDDTSVLGVARGTEAVREIAISGTDTRMCVIDDEGVSIRWALPAHPERRRYEFHGDLPGTDFAVTLGRDTEMAGWFYTGGQRFQVRAAGEQVQNVTISDLRTVPGDTLLMSMFEARCISQLEEMVKNLRHGDPAAG
ncbi:MAG: hypothetical protein B7Y00_05625 [Sphingomonadales bacterium 17-56-6]|nr:MAG: hypothetical protein B7Y00_05625 [Sphingomonadales bacterium 17-56-6]